MPAEFSYSSSVLDFTLDECRAMVAFSAWVRVREGIATLGAAVAACTREAGSRKKLAQHARGASQTKLRALSSVLCARRMHGDGVYVDAAGETWKGTWFNGNGPELLNVQ